MSAKWSHAPWVLLLASWYERLLTAVITAEKRGRFTMSTGAQPQPDQGQKVLDTIGELAQVATNIASRYGHPNVATAITQNATLAPVFYSIFESIFHLVHHSKQPAAK